MSFTEKEAERRNIELDLSDKRILVLDDDELVCRLVSHFLANSGFTPDHINIARSIMDAEKALREKHFDILWADYSLTDGDGVAFAKSHRNEYNALVVCTGNEAPVANLTKAMDGILLGKPFDLQKIRDIVTAAFEQASHHRGKY